MNLAPLLRDSEVAHEHRPTRFVDAEPHEKGLDETDTQQEAIDIGAFTRFAEFLGRPLQLFHHPAQRAEG